MVNSLAKMAMLGTLAAGAAAALYCSSPDATEPKPEGQAAAVEERPFENRFQEIEALESGMPTGVRAELLPKYERLFELTRERDLHRAVQYGYKAMQAHRQIGNHAEAVAYGAELADLLTKHGGKVTEFPAADVRDDIFYQRGCDLEKQGALESAASSYAATFLYPHDKHDEALDRLRALPRDRAYRGLEDNKGITDQAIGACLQDLLRHYLGSIFDVEIFEAGKDHPLGDSLSYIPKVHRSEGYTSARFISFLGGLVTDQMIRDAARGYAKEHGIPRYRAEVDEEYRQARRNDKTPGIRQRILGAYLNVTEPGKELQRTPKPLPKDRRFKEKPKIPSTFLFGHA